MTAIMRQAHERAAVPESLMSSFPATADVVIAGGAAIGSSVACHLAMDPDWTGSVVVVEKDPTYRFCASALSAASIRQQFSCPVNIAISLHGLDFFERIGDLLEVDGDRPDVGFVERGYLYLAGSPEGAAVLAENHIVQAQAGADILLLDDAALAARFPWLSRDGVCGASWGRTGEGWFDGWGLMQAYRRKARSLGVTYLHGEVVDIERANGRVTAVHLADGSRIACGALVDAAGASGGRQLAARAGIAIPVFAEKRCVFTFTCREPLAGFPLLIDPTGVWCRPEGHGGADGQLYLSGGAPRTSDGETPDFDVDWSLFEEEYWPALAARVPAFEAIRPGRAWAGHYDMNRFDHNAFVGPAGDPANFYLANGFSGHGLQQSPAVGRGLAELIAHGAYRTLDLSEMGFERLAANRPLLERNII